MKHHIYDFSILAVIKHKVNSFSLLMCFDGSAGHWWSLLLVVMKIVPDVQEHLSTVTNNTVANSTVANKLLRWYILHNFQTGTSRTYKLLGSELSAIFKLEFRWKQCNMVMYTVLLIVNPSLSAHCCLIYTWVCNACDQKVWINIEYMYIPMRKWKQLVEYHYAQIYMG